MTLEAPYHETVVDQLPVSVFRTNEAMGAAAAAEAAGILRGGGRTRVANVIVATGNSQLPGRAARTPDVPWDRINVFHMDEYVDLPAGHSASFPAFPAPPPRR